MIAAKLEEIYPPKVADFAYVTDGACTQEDIQDKELVIMKVRQVWRMCVCVFGGGFRLMATEWVCSWWWIIRFSCGGWSFLHWAPILIIILRWFDFGRLLTASWSWWLESNSYRTFFKWRVFWGLSILWFIVIRWWCNVSYCMAGQWSAVMWGIASTDISCLGLCVIRTTKVWNCRAVILTILALWCFCVLRVRQISSDSKILYSVN